MKNEAKIPLTNGAVVVRRTVTLGMGHVAEVTIRYDGPSEPLPSTGAVWPPERDWPSARVTVTLPSVTNDTGRVRPTEDMQCPTVVLGMSLDTYWGIRRSETRSNPGGSQVTTYGTLCDRDERNVGASLRQVAAGQLRRVLAELRPVQAHLRARAARIAAREQTLLAGQDMAPLKNQ